MSYDRLRVRLDTAYFAKKLKIENNKKVTVHAFGTIHKLKITVLGQWTMPDTRPGKKKTQKMQRKKHNTQMPPNTLNFCENVIRFSQQACLRRDHRRRVKFKYGILNVIH